MSVVQEAGKDALISSKLMYVGAQRNRAQKVAYIKLISNYTNNCGPNLAFGCISVTSAGGRGFLDCKPREDLALRRL